MFDRYDLIWIATLIGALALQLHIQTTDVKRVWRFQRRMSLAEIDRFYRRQLVKLYAKTSLCIALLITTVIIALENRP